MTSTLEGSPPPWLPLLPVVAAVRLGRALRLSASGTRASAREPLLAPRLHASMASPRAAGAGRPSWRSTGASSAAIAGDDSSTAGGANLPSRAPCKVHVEGLAAEVAVGLTTTGCRESPLTLVKPPGADEPVAAGPRAAQAREPQATPGAARPDPRTNPDPNYGSAATSRCQSSATSAPTPRGWAQLRAFCAQRRAWGKPAFRRRARARSGRLRARAACARAGRRQRALLPDYRPPPTPGRAITVPLVLPTGLRRPDAFFRLPDCSTRLTPGRTTTARPKRPASAGRPASSRAARATSRVPSADRTAAGSPPLAEATGAGDLRRASGGLVPTTRPSWRSAATSCSTTSPPRPARAEGAVLGQSSRAPTARTGAATMLHAAASSSGAGLRCA
jgi:hypothetical protein